MPLWVPGPPVFLIFMIPGSISISSLLSLIALHLSMAFLKELSSEEYIKTRNVKSEDFYVLKNTEAPAVLLELGFLSNEQERSNLSDDNYQNRLAEALTSSIIKTLQQ